MYFILLSRSSCILFVSPTNMKYLLNEYKLVINVKIEASGSVVLLYPIPSSSQENNCLSAHYKKEIINLALSPTHFQRQ